MYIKPFKKQKGLLYWTSADIITSPVSEIKDFERVPESIESCHDIITSPVSDIKDLERVPESIESFHDIM